LTLSELQSRDKNLVRLTFADPLFLLTLHQTDGRTNLLANPQIRVRNKEKAKIHIGDRVPVLTTTAAAAGSFVSQSVTYLDVGLKLEVEPLVYIDDDVGIKLSLEVSSITNTIQTPSGTGTTLVYQVGTRNTTTVLRLHDGETQVLAGLISDEDRRSAVRVPGIGEIPALGRLFSSTSDNTVKTEIVLLITPRLVRTMQRADARTVEFAAGTEASSSGGPLGGVSAPPFPPQTPQFQPAPQAAPAYVPNVPVPTTGGTQVPFGGMQPGQ
jgi:general secretion pathway protein D